MKHLRLLQEDKEFEKFVRDVAYEMLMLNNKQASDLVASIYSFYQMGMTTTDIANWMRQVQTFKEDDDDEETLL